jgi:hypothetical protein
MTNILDILTDKYDAWYDSVEGRPLYESELKYFGPMAENSLHRNRPVPDYKKQEARQ